MGFLRSERRWIPAVLSLMAILALQGAAWAVEPFKIKEIRAEGLQRLEIGTVLTYLPLSVGDEINDTT
jgi:outer membrane protein insertion porin family